MNRVTIWLLFICVAYSVRTTFAGRKCDTFLDVGFLLDSSASIYYDDHYDDEKDFLIALTKSLGISKTGSHAGVITFSDRSDHSIKLKDHYDMNSFSQAVKAIPLMRSLSRFDKALKLAKKELFQARNGARNNTRKLLILLTDGVQTTGDDAVDPTIVANELREMGVTVMAVGMGSGVMKGELNRITKEHAYYASTFRELVSDKFIKKLTGEICKVSKEPVPGGVKITWIKYALGWWHFKFGKLKLSFYSVGNGYININGKNVKLNPGSNKKLPASQGYAWFRWGTFTYYLRFYKHFFYVYQFGRCTKSYNGVKGFCGSSKITKGKGCCDTIILTNTHISDFNGAYHLTGTSNGRSYWVQEGNKQNKHAIWYMVGWHWGIGSLNVLGTRLFAYTTGDIQEATCPNEQGNWRYWDQDWKATDAVNMICNGKEPVPGGWSSWGAYTQCSKKCGGGYKYRMRTCSPPKNGGKPCVGSAVNHAQCNTQPCSGQLVPLRNAHQSSTYNRYGCRGADKCVAAWAIDGDMTTAAVTDETNGVKSWSAELTKYVKIEKILVSLPEWALKQGKYSKFKVETRLNVDDNWKICKKEYGIPQASFNPHKLMCEEPTIAKYVKLSASSNTNMYLLEVQVYGTVLGCYVEIFEHARFKGTRDVYSGSVSQVRHNNMMSSLKVPRGCCVTIYEDANFRGRKQNYCGSSTGNVGYVSYVGGSWNDKMSSLRVSSIKRG